MAVDDRIFQTSRAVAYSLARSQIRNGDILLGHGRALFSRAIQAATRSPWSHVAFIWKLDAIDRILVLESVETFGVRAISLSTKINGGSTGRPYRGDLLVARHRDFESLVDDAAMSRMTAFAVDRLGCRYDPGEVIQIAARIMAGSLRLPVENRHRAGNTYVCSEFAAECYQAIGIEIPWNRRGFISPADFAADPKVDPVMVLKPG